MFTVHKDVKITVQLFKKKKMIALIHVCKKFDKTNEFICVFNYIIIF